MESQPVNSLGGFLHMESESQRWMEDGKALLCVDSLLGHLHREKRLNCSSIKDITCYETLEMELTFLRLLVLNISKWSQVYQCDSLQSLLLDAKAFDICFRPDHDDQDRNSNLMAAIDWFKPKVKSVFMILSNNKEFRSALVDFNLLNVFIDSLLTTLKSLCSCVYIRNSDVRPDFQTEPLLDSLHFLQPFMAELAKQSAFSIKHPKCKDLAAHLADAAVSAANFVYLSFVNTEHTKIAEGKVYATFAELRSKFSPNSQEDMDMYLGVLKEMRLSGSNLVFSFLHFLLYNFRRYITKDEWKILGEEMTFLVMYIIDAPEQCPNDVELVLHDMKAVVREASTFNFSFKIFYSTYTRHIIVMEVKQALSKILDKIKLIKVELLLLELHNGNSHLMATSEDPSRNVQERLRILTEFLTGSMNKNRENVKLFFSLMEAVSREIESFHCAFFTNETARDMVNNMSFTLVKLIEKFVPPKVPTFLQQLLDIEATLVVPVKHRIMSLQEALKYLTSFLPRPSKENQDTLKQLLKHIEVGSRAASLFYYDSSTEIGEDMVMETSFELLKVLQIIVLSRAEHNLVEMLSRKSTLFVPLTDLLQSLHQGVSCLRRLVEELMLEMDQDWKSILKNLEPVVCRASYLWTILEANEITQKKIAEMEIFLYPLQENIKLFQGQLKDIYLQVRSSSRSLCPQTDGLGFVDRLVGNLEEMLKHEADCIPSVKFQIESIFRGLKCLKSMFKKVTRRRNENPKAEELYRRFIDVAYEAEFVIESSLNKDAIMMCGNLRLSYIMEEIIDLSSQALETFERTIEEGTIHPDVQTYKAVTSQPLGKDKITIVLKDQTDIIIDRLIRGTSEMDIVSIFGMPGLGKTTLAKEVFNDPKVAYHFNVRAWCCVSQVYERKELLLDLLSCVLDITDKMREMKEEDLAHELYRQLSGKRYLIVVDDLWNQEPLNDLGQSFPRNQKGSRILITSRKKKVASQANSHWEPHPLRLLSEEESWRFLQGNVKLFQEESCPKGFFEIGKQIACNCKGLPLALVVIGGLLEKLERALEHWKQIAGSLTAHIVDDPESNCMKILELSYKELPDHLKACFLYFGLFPVGKEVPAMKLVNLWIAEGFVCSAEQEGWEEIAEGYLEDLIDRSLVIVSRKRSKGGVKACRIHDMTREMCLVKAKAENYLQIVLGYGDLFPSDGLDSDIDLHSPQPSKAVRYMQHRLSIYAKRKHLFMLKPSGPRVHSLFFFASNDANPRFAYDLSFVSENFGWLRVLDLESINTGKSFLDGMKLLIHLRYLAIKGEMNSVPSSIANLHNLETFMVKGFRGEILLPEAIWSMKKLRHILVKNRAAFSMEDYKEDGCCQLNYLVSLSSPSLSSGTEKILRRSPNLRKFSCIYSDSLNSSKSGNPFPILNFLTKLESLKIFYYGKAHKSYEISFPANLKKLTLSKFRMPWKCISAIADLPNLEVLKLLFKAFEGERWEMGEEKFMKLRFLKLENLDIVQWDAASDHFPTLERLTLQNCNNLMEVPLSFGEITTLQIIEAHFCNHQAVKSVRIIQEQQLEFSNEDFKCIIN